MLALAGFSTGIAILLGLGMLTLWRGLELPWVAKLGGFAMLICLVLTSWQHVAMVGGNAPSALYGSTLFLQTFGFYLLLRGALQSRPNNGLWDLALASALLLLALMLPVQWRVIAAMLIGTLFALHIAYLLWRLRSARRWFRLELPIVVVFAAMAVIVGAAGALAGGLAPALVSWAEFALLYSIQIAIGFALVAVVLVAVPDILDKTREAVSSSYAQSTLGRVDVARALEQLNTLLTSGKLYQDEDLSLARLAEEMQLSSHQLSELINTQFGLSFSRLVRRHRVAAAKQMLIDEPRASVLAVGMSVGFGSQSSFYLAFKDEVGVVPGEFRRRQGAQPAPE